MNNDCLPRGPPRDYSDRRIAWRRRRRSGVRATRRDGAAGPQGDPQRRGAFERRRRGYGDRPVRDQNAGRIATGRGSAGAGPEQEQAAAEAGGKDAHGNGKGADKGKKSEKVAQRLARMKGNGKTKSQGR